MIPNAAREPSDAVDILVQKILRARELLYAGDEKHIQELKQLSDMIDDYVTQAQGQKFQPKQYQNPDRYHDNYPQSQIGTGANYPAYYSDRDRQGERDRQVGRGWESYRPGEEHRGGDNPHRR